MSTLPPPPSPLDWAVNTDKLTATRTSLIEAQNAVHAATANPTKFRKKAKEFTAKILSPAKAVVDILEALGGFHPAIKAVAGVLKGVIQLEETRGDIDRRIAAFFPEIVSLLLLYTKLGPVFNDEREHRLQLDDQLGKVTESIIKFGSFSENYYKRKRKLLHFVLFAAGLKQELDDLLKAFIQLTQGINTLVLHKSALTVTTVAYNMVTGADLEEEFRKFKDAIHKEDDRERQAALAVAAAGGLNAALKDPESIAQFTEAFGKQVTPSIRKAFTEDMKKILKKDGEKFGILLHGAEKKFDQVLKRFDQGPHELLQDPDLKDIWRDSKFGTSQKRHKFIEALRIHFSLQNKDATTTDSIQEVQSQALTLLERPLFYGPILDAIDDDHAGYVSIRKLNLFISNKPKHWSLLRWLTFSAAGWERINIRYMKLIAELFLTRLGDAVESGPNGPFVKEYLKVVKPEILAISSSSHADNAHPADLEDYLAELEKEIDDIQKDHIAVKLKALKYQVTSPELVSGVVPSPRLEESILCLVTLLLQNHIETLENEKKISRAQYLVMVASFSTICEAFTSRFEYLKASWISDAKLDMAVQIHRYAGGLFEGVWMATMAPTEQISDNPKERSPENDKSDLVPTTKNLHPGHQLGHKSISDPQPTGPNQQDHVREQSLPLIHSALHDQSRVTIERAGIAGDHQSRGTISKLAQSAGEQQDRPRERPSLPSPALHGQSEVIYGHHHLLGPPSRSLLGTGSKTSLARPLPKPPGSGAAISHSVQAPVALTPNHQIGPDQYQSPVQPAYRDDTDTSSKRNRLVSNFHHVYIASHSSLGRIDPEQRQDVSPPLSYPYVSSETGSQRGLRHPVDSQETVLRHLPKNDSKDEGLGMALKKIWKKFKGRDSDTYHTSAQCSSPVGGTGAQTPRHNLSSSSVHSPASSVSIRMGSVPPSNQFNMPRPDATSRHCNPAPVARFRSPMPPQHSLNSHTQPHSMYQAQPSGLTATTSKAPKVSTIASSTYTKTAKAMEARAMDASNQLLGMPKKARGTAGPLPGGSARRHRLEEVQNKKASKGEILHSDRNRPRTGGPEVQLRNIGRKADRSTAGSMELCTPAKATRQQPFSSHLMSQTSSLKAGPEHAVPSSSRPRPANSQNTRPAKSLLVRRFAPLTSSFTATTQASSPSFSHPSRAKEGVSRATEKPLPAAPHPSRFNTVERAPLSSSPHHASVKGVKSRVDAPLAASRNHLSPKGKGTLPHRGNGMQPRSGPSSLYTDMMEAHSGGRGHGGVKAGTREIGHAHPYEGGSEVRRGEAWKYPHGNHVDGRAYGHQQGYSDNVVRNGENGDGNYDPAGYKYFSNVQQRNHMEGVYDTDGNELRSDMDDESDMLEGSSDSDDEEEEAEAEEEADTDEEDDGGDSSDDDGSGSRPDLDEEELGASDSDEEGDSWRNPRFADRVQEEDVDDVDEDEDEDEEASDSDEEGRNWSTPRFGDGFQEANVEDIDEDEEEASDTDEEDEGGDNSDGNEVSDGDDEEDNWSPRFEDRLEEDDVDDTDDDEEEVPDSDEEDEDDYEGEESAEGDDDEGGSANNWNGGQEGQERSYRSVEASDSDEEAERYSDDDGAASFDGGQQYAGEAYQYSGDGRETSFDNGGYYSTGYQQDAGEAYGYSGDGPETSFDDGGYSYGDQQDAGEDYGYSDDDRATSFDDGGSSSGDQQYAEDGSYSDDDVDDNYSYPTRY